MFATMAREGGIKVAVSVPKNSRSRTDAEPFIVKTGQTIHVLPDLDGFVQRIVFVIRNVVTDSSAFKGRDTARVGNLSQQARVACAMPGL